MKLKKIFSLCLSGILLSLNLQAQETITPNFINHRGQDIFLSGINVAWMSYGHDLTGFDKEKWEAICDDVVSAGGNSLRWWIHVDGRSTPTYSTENDLVTGISEKALDNLALAMDIAATKGVVVSLCLWAHQMMNTDDGDKGTTQAITRVRRNKLLLTNAEATQSYIDNALIPMVERVKNHTAVLCWEIFNEPEGMTSFANWAGFSQVSITDIQRFVNMCAGAIHRTDPTAKVSNGAWRLNYTSEYYGGKNYYSDEALIAAGNDKDGYLDFYMFHYYPNEVGSDYSPFHKDFNTLQLSKNTIIGEFPAHGIVKIKGQTFIPRKQLTTTQAMLWLYQNGYSGGWGWTYTAHDGCGGLEDMREAMDTLKKLYPEHIVIKHDPSFNYIPRITKRIADTVLFTNSEKITNYITASDYFEDDENDVLTYTIESSGIIVGEIQDNKISFSVEKDKTGYGTILVTATDKGGKTISQSFSVLVRDEVNTSENKLLNAFTTCSSIEEDQYRQYYATDGDLATRWSSAYNDDEYILFDMMKEEEIRRLVLYWEWNEAESKGAYAQAYTIEVSSDKKNWEPVFSVAQGQTIKSNIVLRKDDEAAISCRYIRIHFTERATSWGYSLREVEAYDFDDHANNATRNKINTRTKYQATYVNSEFKYQILRSFFVDNNNDVLRISALNLPEWLNFDDQTLTLQGTPSAKDEGSHIVTIKSEDYFGVTISYDLEVYVWPSTSVEEPTKLVNIYPNPCIGDTFTIAITNIEGKALASFTDANGKLAGIKYIQFNNGTATCTTAGLAKGIYVATIRINGETYKEKVVIE